MFILCVFLMRIFLLFLRFIQSSSNTVLLLIRYFILHYFIRIIIAIYRLLNLFITWTNGGCYFWMFVVIIYISLDWIILDDGSLFIAIYLYQWVLCFLWIMPYLLNHIHIYLYLWVLCFLWIMLYMLNHIRFWRNLGWFSFYFILFFLPFILVWSLRFVDEFILSWHLCLWLIHILWFITIN